MNIVRTQGGATHITINTEVLCQFTIDVVMCMVGCIKLESSLRRQTLRLKLSLEFGRELVCLTVYSVAIWQLGFAQYCISLVPILVKTAFIVVGTSLLKFPTLGVKLSVMFR